MTACMSLHFCYKDSREAYYVILDAPQSCKPSDKRQQLPQRRWKRPNKTLRLRRPTTQKHATGTANAASSSVLLGLLRISHDHYLESCRSQVHAHLQTRHQQPLKTSPCHAKGLPTMLLPASRQRAQAAAALQEAAQRRRSQLRRLATAAADQQAQVVVRGDSHASGKSMLSAQHEAVFQLKRVACLHHCHRDGTNWRTRFQGRHVRTGEAGRR